MEKWHQLGRKIREYVNPSTFPVAIKFLEDGSQILSSARRPLRDLGVKMAPCQGAAMARRYGWTVAFGKDAVGCAIAAHTYNWERLTEESGAVKFLTRMNYAGDEKAAHEVIGGCIAEDYRAWVPVHITFWGGLFDEAVEGAALREPAIIDAERQIDTSFRWKLEGERAWRDGGLVARDDYEAQHIGLVGLWEGHWPAGRALAVERTVRRTGIALLLLGLAAGAVLWARVQWGVRVDAPVQLWLLFAVGLVTGGVAVYSTSL